MNDILIQAASAFWLGIVTAISPCPLSTNIVAISYIGRRAAKPKLVLLSGLLYTIGLAMTYTIVAILLVSGILSAPGSSHFLQKYMNKLLGPILIVAGMFMLRLIEFGGSGAGVSEQTQKRVDSMGIWGAFLLGILLALSFCPVSAWIFFGSLMPLAVKYHSPLLMPSLYGIGTALPALVFASLIAIGSDAVGGGFDKTKKIERWARPVTGWLLVGIGIYFSLVHIYGILS
jgi:cytochrome c biogenesis protein CcdA